MPAKPHHKAIGAAATLALIVVAGAFLHPGARHALYSVLWAATWGNNVAWLESLALAGVATWAFRDHLGARLAAWWAKHHGPHAIEQHKQALAEHEAERETGQ